MLEDADKAAALREYVGCGRGPGSGSTTTPTSSIEGYYVEHEGLRPRTRTYLVDQAGSLDVPGSWAE